MFSAEFFGKRLKDLRTEMKLSVIDAAKRMEINNATLKKYEEGQCKDRIDPTVLSKIAAFYGCSIDFLFGKVEMPSALYFMAIDDVVEKSYEKYIKVSRANRETVEYIWGKVEAPYPYNLLEEVFGERFAEVPVPLNDRQKAYIKDAISQLKERERGCLLDYYLNGMTLVEIGDIYGVGKERIRQIIAKAIRKLRHRALLGQIDRWAYPKDYQKCLDARETKKKLLADIRQEENAIDILKKTMANPDFECDEAEKFVSIKESPLTLLDLADQGLSVRTFNALRRAFDGCSLYDPNKKIYVKDHPYAKIGSRNATIDDIYKLYASGDIKKVRNLGKKSIEEIARILEANGYSV